MKKNKLNKTPKQIKKEQKYLEKFGIPYSEINTKENKAGKLTYLKKLKPYFKGEGWQISLVIFLCVLLIGVNILSPIILNIFTENLLDSQFEKALIFVCILVGSYIAVDTLRYLSNIICYKIINRVILRLRRDMSDSITRTKLEKYNQSNSGDILNRLNYDPKELYGSIDILMNFGKIFVHIGRLAMFFTFSIYIGIYMVVAGVIIYIVPNIISKKYKNPIRIRDAKVSDRYQTINNEMVKGIRDIKGLNITSIFLKKLNKNLKYSHNSNNSLQFANETTDQFSLAMLNIFSLGGYVLSVFLIMNDMFSVANFITLFSYDFGIYNAFINMATIKDQLYKMEISTKRMMEFFDDKEYPKESFGNVELKNIQGKVEFKKVNFKYENNVIFKNLSFVVNAGECVGIVGKSGEGKSTILSLIPKFFDIDSGKILLDDIDNRKLSQNSLRNAVSIVLQSPYIFNASIKENLLLAKEDATDEELVDVCKKAHIYDFILSQPNKFDTFVGEGGVILSGGQRQRLAIARAFLRNSKILLLDEATSALDNKSQEKIKQTIDNMKGTCTTIIVAHRLSTIVDCDRILVLDDHKIVAEGTHKELLKNCELYRNLYQTEENKAEWMLIF